MSARGGSDPARPGPGRNREASGGFQSQAEAQLGAPDDDVQLMLAFQGGEVRAFEELFERWSGPLLRYLERMTRDAASAEELLQEAFFRVHRARERYEPRAKFSTWLYQIATNLARNELRRPRRRDPHRSLDEEGAPALAAANPGTDEAVDARRRAASVERQLAGLPERQREALWLSAVEGLSYADVAEALDVTPAAVKSLVHRARVTLAEKLEAED